ncbi:hypothetical protein PG996_004702 [Apiospora saccharicola]|uniref:Uncharacterized protein n=1 Tax=Apiospora saccharicola TaxID=335842 RepID=A0ABR1W651_9PEZI
MPRGLHTRFDRLSTEDNSRIAIKQEVSDRKVKRKPANNEHVGIETQKDETDDHNLLWSIPQFPGNQPDGSDDNDSDAAIKDEGQDVVIKEENQPTKKRARTTHRPRVPAGYHWDDATVDATIHARELGITELSSG